MGNWIEDLPVPFSSLARCVGHLRDEREGGGDEFDRYVVSRAKVDLAEGADDLYSNEIVLDGDFRPLEVSAGGLDERDAELSWSLRGAFVELPVPFMSGDIVIDRTSRAPRPFVFAFAIPWERDGDGSVRIDEERHRALLRELYKDRNRVIAASNIKACYGWRMTAYGYEVEVGTGLVEARTFGACRNYLNLEYYDGPLDGDLRQLATVSELVRGELDFGVAANFNRLAAMGSHAQAMLR